MRVDDIVVKRIKKLKSLKKGEDFLLFVRQYIPYYSKFLRHVNFVNFVMQKKNREIKVTSTISVANIT